MLLQKIHAFQVNEARMDVRRSLLQKGQRRETGLLINLKDDSLFFKSFNNSILHKGQRLEVPVNWRVCSYLCKERKNLSVEVL